MGLFNIPGEGEATSCGRQMEKREKSSDIYRDSCGVCRLFGHMRLRGRSAFTDLFPAGAVPTEVRYGVAISRLSHAVAQGPFEMEVAVGGIFRGYLVLENYELWQLGLLAVALQAMNHGLLKLGYGKNRGFGKVKVSVPEVEIEEVAPLKDNTVLRGLAAFVDEEVRRQYGFGLPDSLEVPLPAKTESLGFYIRRVYDKDGWLAISQKSITAVEAS